MGKVFSFEVHTTILTTPSALACAAWTYGEADIAARALVLDAQEVLDIGIRARTLIDSGQAETAWPNGPKLAPRSLLLATIEHLEGTYRPCRLDIALPVADLPIHLQVTKKQYTAERDAVDRAKEARRKAGHPVP